jgi:hypothetical protein
LDPENSGVISFEQYVKDAFENFYDKENLEKDLESFREEDQDLLEVNRLYKAEKERWNFLSGNKRELNHEKFYKFIHPEEFENLKDLESEIYFKYFDTNKDGLVSLNEYKNYYKSKLDFALFSFWIHILRRICLNFERLRRVDTSRESGHFQESN